MSDFTVSRLGQVNASGDALALFLKKFAGEVLTTFAEENVVMPLHLVRTIENGKSAQFPVTGTASAAYHTPGTELVGNAIKHNEKVISIDSLLVAHTFVANIDEAMNHYDVRSIYSAELGRALANKADKQLLQVGCLAARASATISGGNGGAQITDADANTNGASLAGSIFTAAQKLDEKNVPANDRYAIVRPAQYYLLVQTTDVINRDWGGSGVYADGKVLKVAGVHIVKSNHLPSANLSQETGTNNTYHGDFSNTYGLVFQKAAFGTVKLLDLATESEYSARYQGTLLVAKYAMGHGILRPECAIEIITA